MLLIIKILGRYSVQENTRKCHAEATIGRTVYGMILERGVFEWFARNPKKEKRLQHFKECNYLFIKRDEVWHCIRLVADKAYINQKGKRTCVSFKYEK